MDREHSGSPPILDFTRPAPGKTQEANRSWPWRALATTLALLLPMLALAAGSGHSRAQGRGVPERTIFFVQQGLAGLTGSSPDAVVYGGSREVELLRQIIVATPAGAQAQIELLRQQNEILRLLEELARRDEGTRAH